jgi:hypothetical protein
MDPIEKQERKREARHRLRAQRQRAGQLRGRVVTISMIAFAMLWGIVFVQMATGNDPVLGDSSSTIAASHRNGSDGRKRRAAGAIPAAATETTELKEAHPEVVEPEPVEAEIAEPEPEPAPVITSQS